MTLCLLFCCGCAAISLPTEDGNQDQGSATVADSTQELAADNSEGDQAAQQNTADSSESVLNSSSKASTEGESGAGKTSSSTSDSASSSGTSSNSTGSSGSSSGSSGSSSTTSAKISVHVYIDASAASSLGYASCMASTTVKLDEGASAYDALKATGVSVGGSSTYVSSINGLAEKALGGTSGWMYSVNGDTPMKSAGSYVLSSGDEVRWYYVDSW